MSDTSPEIMQALWNAFPLGYWGMPCTVTLGGWSVLKGKDAMPIWFNPNGGTFCRGGMEEFTEAKNKLDLLPDPNHPVTRTLLRHMLAERAGIDPSNGVFWAPKGREVLDRKRMGTSKVLSGWSLKTLTRTMTITVDSMDPVISLLQAIEKTNCTCGSTYMSLCPLHGTTPNKPWR